MVKVPWVPSLVLLIQVGHLRQWCVIAWTIENCKEELYFLDFGDGPDATLFLLWRSIGSSLARWFVLHDDLIFKMGSDTPSEDEGQSALQVRQCKSFRSLPSSAK